MADTVTAGEVLLALAVIGVLASVGGMTYRTYALGREGNLAVMATRYPRGNWRTGMVRYRPDRLEWFTFRSLRLRPERTWQRGEFVLGSRRALGQGDLPRAMTGDAVSVDVEYDGQTFTIAMAPGDYTALRSWSESAPPGSRAAII